MPGTRARRAALALAAPVIAAPLLLTSLPAAHAEDTTEPAVFAQPVAPQATVTAVRKVRPDSRVKKAFGIARAQLGDPYRYGAAGPGAFDCSGLVYFATHRAGFKGVPRTSSAQSHYMRHIPRKALKPGDFVFFSSGGGVYHVGLYAGSDHGRRFIVHAPYPGAHVRREAIWTDGWFAGTLRGR